MRNIAAAIEFGTSKIVCVIGRERSAGRFEVLGSGEAKYEGFRKGRFIKPSGVEEAAAKALFLAEKKARKRVKDIYVGAPGVFCKVVCKDGFVETNGIVRQTDVDKLIDNAERFATETKYSVITSNPVFFILDDNKHYIDAVGNRSHAVKGKVSFVLAKNSYIKNMTMLLKKLNVEIRAFIPDMMAESLFIVPTQERDHSAVLLNVGYYDTNVTVVYGDAIVYNKTIGVGGMQVANDLALVLNIDVDLAEQLKRRYSFGLSTGGEKLYDYAKSRHGRMEKFNHGLVSEVIEARVEHLCLLVGRAFEKSPINIARRTRIYLSGGGLAMMRGAKDTLQKYLKRQVRMTNIEAPQLSTPNYYVALGLLDYVFETDYCSEGYSGEKLLEMFSGK